MQEIVENSNINHSSDMKISEVAEMSKVTNIDPHRKTNTIYALIPAYNEELTIGSVILLTKKYVDKVVIVDDGSTDKTVDIAKQTDAKIITVSHCGKAGAMMEGFAYLRTINPTVVVMLDSDGQHNPEEIPKIIKPILMGEADLVIGSRFMFRDGEDGIQGYRKFGQKILNNATNVVSTVKCTDSQSGYRALSASALVCMDFKSDGYNLESDMIARISKVGLKITEVPINVLYDAPNMHKSGPIQQGISVLYGIFQLFTIQHPLICFGLPGFIIFGIGIVLAVQLINIVRTTGIWASTLTLLTCLMLIIGMLLIAVGLILSSISRLIKMR